MMLIVCIAALAAPANAAYAEPAVDWTQIARLLREEYPTAGQLNSTNLVRQLADRAVELGVDRDEFATNFRVLLSLLILSPGEKRALAIESEKGMLPESLNTTEEILSHLAAHFPNHNAVLNRRLDVIAPRVEKLGAEAKDFVKKVTAYAIGITRTRLSHVVEKDKDRKKDDDEGKAARKALDDQLVADYGRLSAACQSELERAFPARTLRKVAGSSVEHVAGLEEHLSS
ncbi:hypothetical protein PRIPAC_94773 [Pristionchus pacificus]|uniref:Uncharacterized protein n=1 Tax=Pristionchus pacificus TaxID=54126 RepID=A0A454XIF0_PRIPA|nr:hypothetical protein PRIPAC_94773 [Pristionchus pacificus]|eukprot:PDM76235.1 hypothetical protein PRIPAC_39839 [Pristionchus pacificus]